MTAELLSILLVEDNPDDCFVLEQLIREKNLPYRLQTVSTLSQAHQKLGQSTYDIILLDYQLPDGDCFSLLPETREIPVIIISGAGNEHVAVQAMHMGAYDYIIKSPDDGHLALLPSIIENVLKRKRAEIDLITSEQRYKYIVETVPDIIFQLNAEKVVTFANPAVRILGYEPSEITGRRIDEFVCVKKNEDLLQLATKRSGDRATKGLEIRFKSRNGTLVWEEMKVSLLNIDSFGLWDKTKTNGNKFLGTQCVAWDITERKKTEFALLHSKEELQSILSNAMDGIITINENGIIELFNPAAERIFGYKKEELTGKSINLLMPEPDRSRHDGYIQNYVHTGQTKVLGRAREVVAIRKNGEEFPIELSASEISARSTDKLSPETWGNEPTGRMFIGIVRDITERKRVENELKLYRENLEDLIAKRTIELHTTHAQLLHAEKLSALGKLSASIAHEFNNPIFGIRNVLEQVNEGVSLDQTYKNLVTMAVTECNRVAALTRKLQNFYSPSSDTMAVLNVHEIIDDITLLLKQRFMEKKICMEKRYAPDLPLVKAVGDQMKQVILNIIQNAEEAIPESGAGGKITITTEKTEQHVKIHVNDSGVGILPEHKPSLFDPFFSTKTAIKGTGLGLSVSYGIMKKHGGDIKVESEPGNTTFTLTLPAQEK